MNDLIMDVHPLWQPTCSCVGDEVEAAWGRGPTRFQGWKHATMCAKPYDSGSDGRQMPTKLMTP